MTAPTVIERNGHGTWLKWHRGRRRARDPVFTGARILEGMRAGASVEVDLVVHGEHGFAVLHDHEDISRETTGSGPARAHTAAEFRELHLRGNDGEPIAEPVMLLDDLCALLARDALHSDALLQLDYKEGQGPLDPATLASFGRSVGPVARSMIVSSGEADSVAALVAAAPGIRIGYDPCHGEAIARVRATGDFARFVAEALDDSLQAEMIYLDYRLVLLAADADFDIVAAFQKAGRRIDAYTIKTADETTRPIIERLLGLRVDQITTDDADGLLALMEHAVA